MCLHNMNADKVPGARHLTLLTDNWRYISNPSHNAQIVSATKIRKQKSVIFFNAKMGKHKSND